jgi:cell division protein FtsB
VFASRELQRLKEQAAKEAPRRKARKSKTTKAIRWFIVLYIAFLFGSQEWKLFQIKQEKAYIQQQAQVYQTKNDLRRAQIKYLSSNEYIEKAARDQLGFVKPGEVPYLTKPKPQQETSQKKSP